MSGPMSLDWVDTLPSILTEMLGPVKGELAADMWTRRYASGDGPAVIAFMRDVAREYDLSPGQRQALRSAIHRARSGQLSTEVSGPQLQAGRVVARRILAVLRKHILEHPARLRSEFTQVLGREIAPEKGLHEMAAPVLGWMVQGGAMPELNLEELGQVIHATYVTACKVLGPVATDEILVAASRSAESLPESKLYPPARLLYPDKA